MSKGSENNFIFNRKSSPLLLRIFLIILGVSILSTVLWFSLHNRVAGLPAKFPSPTSSLPVDSSQPAGKSLMNQEVVYPTDKLFVIQDRLDYESGSMILEIPRLDLSIPVLGDVTDETLKKGVGLYDYAQPPGPGNRNVSIAGHRDIYGSEFLKVDTITDGDLLYLTYQNIKYTYKYEDTHIVAANDWSPIYCKDFSCITLTSCDPIGTSRNRIIVTGRLISVEEL